MNILVTISSTDEELLDEYCQLIQEGNKLNAVGKQIAELMRKEIIRRMENRP